MDLRCQRHSLSHETSDSSNGAFDPECFEFTTYLGRRLGVDSELAAELLGQWLRTYEPRAFGT